MTDTVKKQWSLTLLWLVTLILAIGMGVMAWQLKEMIAGNNRSGVTLALEAQEKKINLLNQAIEQHDKQFQQIAEHSNQLTAGLKSLDQFIREGNVQWRYVQTHFYLERIAQAAYVMKDPVETRAWLEAALENVTHLNQPNLFPMRDALQQDIQEVSQQGEHATEQAMLSLSALIEKIPTLTHKQVPQKMTPNPQANPAATEKDDWRTAMKAGWNDLKSLVRIRTTDGELIPYLSREEATLVNENVVLMLNQASFSAMRSQEALYQQQINQATLWINRYYDTSTMNVQDALATLYQLGKVNVTFTPPAHFKSFDAWAHFINQSEKPA